MSELQDRLDSQKRRTRQLEEEVSSSQAHIAELTAILKSAVRTSSVSSQAGMGVGVRLGGQAGAQSPRSGGISREGSASEVGARLRSKELQGMYISVCMCILVFSAGEWGRDLDLMRRGEGSCVYCVYEYDIA